MDIFIENKFPHFIEKPKKLGTLANATCILKNHIISLKKYLYASRNIQFLYIITSLDSLLKRLQEFPTYIISHEIVLKCIISNYNRGHKSQELPTHGPVAPPR